MTRGSDVEGAVSPILFGDIDAAGVMEEQPRFHGACDE